MSLDYAALLDDPRNFTAPDAVIALDGADLGPEGLRAGVYLPTSPVRAALIFYHGGGASRLAYGGLADRVRALGATVVVTPDLRGHGESAGPRGYAATPETVWADISSTIAWARASWPGVPVFVGGHSSGGGLIVNWASHRPADAAGVAGVVLLAPMLSRARTRFARARLWVFLAYLFSGRRLMARAHAVRFSYPGQMAAERKLVEAYTPGMSLAVTPRAAGASIGAMTTPVLVMAAEGDELFKGDDTRATAHGAEFVTVDGGHLSCLLSGGERIAAFIQARHSS